MIKTIPIRDLRLGMYIESLGGSWMNHPFWRSSFRLERPEDLKTLRQSGIQAVMIDTAKGLDVETAAGQAAVQQSAPPQAKAAPVRRVSYEEEIGRAKQVQARARRVVLNLFNQARMGQALDVQEVMPMVDEIYQSIDRNSDALMNLMRLKSVDDYTYMHSVAVCVLMMSLGRRLGLDKDLLRQVGMAGLMHDVGKMGVPLEILNKPGKLTDDEFTIVKSHPLKGWEILKSANVTDEITLDVCLHHHERMDGAGYPNKLAGDGLTLYARMGAVCDVYDAVTSDRVYKKGWAPAEAIRRMAEWRDGHFDETVFQAFVKTVGIYPVGSLVRLNSGRLAVVAEQSDGSLLKPKVKVFFSTKSQEPVRLELIDLARSQDGIKSPEDPADWGFDLNKLMGVA